MMIGIGSRERESNLAAFNNIRPQPKFSFARNTPVLEATHNSSAPGDGSRSDWVKVYRRVLDLWSALAIELVYGRQRSFHVL